jgi:hypothetical protein
MARTPTRPPTDRVMWRRLIARAHPDSGGDHELFIWTGAVRDVVCAGLRPRVEDSGQPDPSTPRSTSDDAAHVPFDRGEAFAALTGRALAHAGEFTPVLALLRDCWPLGHLAHEQSRGASYKRLAAIGHAWGMTKAERIRWYRVAEEIPLSDRHAAHILSRSKRSAA